MARPLAAAEIWPLVAVAVEASVVVAVVAAAAAAVVVAAAEWESELAVAAATVSNGSRAETLRLKNCSSNKRYLNLDSGSGFFVPAKVAANFAAVVYIADVRSVAAGVELCFDLNSLVRSLAKNC